MTKSTTLLPLSFALLLSTNTAFASDTTATLGDEEGASNAGTPTPAAVEFDPRDRNKDGKVSLGEKVRDALDLNDDGDIDLKDVKHFPGHILGKIKGIFDTDGDGKLEFDEIISGTKNALEKFETLTGRVLELSNDIQKSDYFALIPEKVKGSLTGLFTIVDQAAVETQKGINIGGKYVDGIEKALETLKGQVSNLLKGEGSPEQMAQAKKDIFAYLEMIKGWYNTGDNNKLVASVEKKLAKAKA